MPATPQLLRNVVAAQCLLVALWLALAVAASIFTYTVAVAAVRSADLGMSDTAEHLARVAGEMADRGGRPADIDNALVAAAKSHGLSANVIPFGSMQPPMRPGGPPGRRGEPYGFVMPAQGPMTPISAFDPPTAAVHVPNGVIVLTPLENPVQPILRAYALGMLLLALVALVTTWLVHERTMRRAFAPVTTIEAALRRLAAGEYSRLAMVGHEPGEAAVIDAYNAAAKELASSVRLRAEAESNLRQFVAEAGHELRTPLTVIMGFVDVLRQGAIAEQALAQRILDSVAAEGERMRSLIGKLLLLARLDALPPPGQDAVDLAALTADAVESFKPIAGATKLSLRAGAEANVIGSASELREVVASLVDNAIKYAPGSNVTVSVSRTDGAALLCVEDDGPGMAPDFQARAFDRFSRGDERGSVPGSGLGLAIVRRIATRAGGSVELSSTLGKGTRVLVRLPLAQTQSPPSSRNV